MTLSNPQSPNRRTPAALITACVIFAALAVLPFIAEDIGSAHLVSLTMRAMVLAIAALSLDLLMGHAGLVSFGHSAFLAIGAYVTGIMLTEGTSQMALIVPLAIGIAGLFAMLSGLVCLRTSGVSFIMITLAFGQMVFFALGSLSQYGGDDGLTIWDTPNMFGLPWLSTPLGLYTCALCLLIAVWTFLGRLAQSRFGRVLHAIRQNPQRAASMGYSCTRHRLVAYVLAGVIAALAGVLWATHAAFVSPSLGSWQRSGDLIVMVVLGGMATRNGALIGALVFVALEEWLSSITHDWRLIFGPLLVLVALYFKGGLASLFERKQRMAK